MMRSNAHLRLLLTHGLIFDIFLSPVPEYSFQHILLENQLDIFHMSRENNCATVSMA